MTTIPKIGFACKWIDRPDQTEGIKPKDDCKQYNTGTTTVAWLNRQSKDVAEQKLWDLMVQNIEAVRRLVERVSTLDEQLRMVRLGSDILPVFTHRDWSYFWLRPDVDQYLSQGFGRVGEIARKHNVRLSFHPGQFTVLASDNPDIVERSLEEFEYHANMAKWMGYGRSFQDFKINVHIAGRACHPAHQVQRSPTATHHLGRLQPGINHLCIQALERLFDAGFAGKLSTCYAFIHRVSRVITSSN